MSDQARIAAAMDHTRPMQGVLRRRRHDMGRERLVSRSRLLEPTCTLLSFDQPAMNAAVLTKSFARAVATARLPTRRPQAAMRAYRTAGLTQEALRSIGHQAAPLAAAGRGSRLQQLRCLASCRDDEPSWSEIASEAGQVAK